MSREHADRYRGEVSIYHGQTGPEHFSLSQPTHSPSQHTPTQHSLSGGYTLLRCRTRAPLSRLPIFISPLISSFVSVSLLLWEVERAVEGEGESCLPGRLGRHRGCGEPCIGVALTWLNSSSGVPLVVSLIPKTSRAPFTASHTELSAESQKHKHRKEKCFARKTKRVREINPIGGQRVGGTVAAWPPLGPPRCLAFKT